MSREVIELSLPAKAEYLTAVRLVAGSIAGQAGFNMEEIEDVKTALSEACLLLMPCKEDTLRLELWIQEGFHAIVRASREQAACKHSPEREFGSFLLEALSDKVEFQESDGESEYRLFKSLQS
jgi:serine/threonine-protein kinase RsbW